MKKILLFVFLFCLSCPGYGQQESLVEQDIIKFSEINSFFKEPTGSIAFLPTVGDERYLGNVWTHILLPKNGYYMLPKKGNCFFRVNNRGSDHEVTYLGVVVYILYPDPITHRNPLNLTRSKKSIWMPGVENRKLDGRIKAHLPKEVGLDKYFLAHQSDSIEKCDQILTFTWHAAVENEAVRNGAPFSWDFKSNWLEVKPPALDKFCKILKMESASLQAAITAYILRFEISPDPSKRVPNTLDFYFNADFAVGAYMRIFSPSGSEFGKEFYFGFKE